MAGREAHLVEIVEVKVAVAETDAGEHGVVLAIGAVGGDVEEGGLSALGLEDFGGGLVAEKEARVGKDGVYCFDFGEDFGGAVVGDAHDKGAGGLAGGLLLAEGEDGGAG